MSSDTAEDRAAHTNENVFGVACMLAGLIGLSILALFTPMDLTAVVGILTVVVLTAAGIPAGKNLRRRRQIHEVKPASIKSQVLAILIFVAMSTVLLFAAWAIDRRLDSSLSFARLVLWLECGALMYLGTMYYVSTHERP